MTQVTNDVGVPVPPTPLSTSPEAPGRRARAAAGPRPRWWRRPWIVPLALLVAAFLLYQLAQFAGRSEAEAPIPPHPGFSLYYPFLIGHMVVGSVLMITSCLQLWPWLRRNHPAVHRVSGRLYVGSALITGAFGLAIVRFAPPVGRLGVILATLLMMVSVIAAVWAARAGRFRLHRRFMLYSFIVMLDIIAGVPIVMIGMSLPFKIDMYFLIEAARWNWVVLLVILEVWLYRTAGRPLDLAPSSRRKAAAAR